MSTNVSSVVSHFPSAEGGFSTTTSGPVSSGDTSVALNSVAGYVSGEIVVFIIDPTDATKKQVFTGVMDTGGLQVTNVVWTSGTNQGHASGATVVDYATATHISMVSKGILVEHNQDGSHKAITAPSVSLTGALSTDTVSEKTVGNGVTIAGVNIKSGALNTNNSVVTGNITANAVTDAKLSHGKIRAHQGSSGTDWSTPGSSNFDVSAVETLIQGGVNAPSGDTTITFPVAFSIPPVVVASTTSASGFNVFTIILGVSATGFSYCQIDDSGATRNERMAWIAIGAA